MIRTLALLSLLLALAGCAVHERTVVVHETDVGSDNVVEADHEIDFAYFHTRLSPYGQWIHVAEYGWCWYPDDVEDDWCPYTRGYWLYVVDDGWCWVSDFVWGWAPFHYGRWHRHGARWVWIPGYYWAGAWVCWRVGGGYIGWAPLPPNVVWEVGIGISLTWTVFETMIPETYWVFCAEDVFASRRLSYLRINRDAARTILPKTSFRGSLTLEGGVIRNRAIPVRDIEEASAEPVPRYSARRTDTLGEFQLEREVPRERELPVYRPRVTPREVPAPERPNPYEGASRTLREKQDAEARILQDRHDRQTRVSPSPDLKERQDYERRVLDTRHSRQDESLTRKYPEQSRSTPKQPPKQPPKESPQQPKRPKGR